MLADASARAHLSPSHLLPARQTRRAISQSREVLCEADEEIYIY